MSEIVLGSFLSLAFEKLASAALQKLGRSMGIHTQLEKLKSSLSQIEALLYDASKKEITNESVKRWLNRLQHLAYDIDDVLDDLATEAMHCELTEESEARPSKVRKLISTFSQSTGMKDKLDDITTRLQDLEKEKVAFGLIVKDEKRKNSHDKRKNETGLPDDESGIVGREGDKQALIIKLLANEPCKENFSIVPIVGMGGVGKTTLARLLYNDKRVKDHFKLMAWVCVSDEFDILRISNLIFKNVTGETKEFTDLNLVQVALQEKLKDEKYLVVLDDVWTDSCDDWEKLVPPFRAVAPGSKIIMTTRKEQLLKQLGYKNLNTLKSLSPEDALSLFAQHAFGVDNLNAYPTLKPKGEGIVKKCDGLPLALKAVGRLLRENTDEEDWEDVLNSEIWRLQDGEGILPALKLSYYDLPSYLKQLFAYCSFFPKDYLFNKEELVLLWMAEGFLHQSTSSKLTERWGQECFEKLLLRSFFEPAPNNDSLYVMHDLMNDMAMFVAGDFFLRLDNNIEMKKDVTKEALEKCRHMSFVCERFIVSKRFQGLERAKSLRTFLMVFAGEKKNKTMFNISNKILGDLLHTLPLLRVLSLSGLSISEVPESIGAMKHLRYLNLSRTRITHLPESFCNLYNLQTLIVFGCRTLTKLPSSFLKLKNLRHLDMRDTPLLKKMPMGISELKSLQTLSKISIGGEDGFAITKLNVLKNLQGNISIEELQNVHNPTEAAEANLSEKRLSELELKWSHDTSEGTETLENAVLDVLKPRDGTLKRLGIMSYGGMDFPNWVGDMSFLRLAKVTISGCKRCTSLPPLAQLPSLKELYIEGMNGVKEVDTTSHAFASLEILTFKNMSMWVKWSTNSGIIVFPCLQKLHIEDCPKLVEVSVETPPSLRVLVAKECGPGVLTSLVRAASLSVTRLDIESVSGLTNEVWRGVMERLGAVEELSIKRCNEITYMWASEAEASKVLVMLRKLEIEDCSNLVRLGEKEEENSDSGSNLLLTSLRIRKCKNMERCSCPDSTELLYIVSCDSVTSITFPTGGGRQKLKSFVIYRCKKLVLGEKKATLDNNISNENGMPHLESVLEFRNIIHHLTYLYIWYCPNMKSFPDSELPNLSVLKHLVIANCGEMDASFPRGLWPPKLQILWIGGLKKPISEWGQQNFPTSIVDLRLHGGSSEGEGVSDFSRLSHLLPPSLTFLWIDDFKKLESVSVGLQHLTSLQHLYIQYCPKMRHLPETMSLLSSLLSLHIYRCPILSERCSKSGSYWPLISHIPCIQIDGKQL